MPWLLWIIHSFVCDKTLCLGTLLCYHIRMSLSIELGTNCLPASCSLEPCSHLGHASCFWQLLALLLCPNTHSAHQEHFSHSCKAPMCCVHFVSYPLDQEFDLRISMFPALRVMCEYLIYLKLFFPINHEGWWRRTVCIVPLETLQQVDMKHVMNLEMHRQFQPVCDRYITYFFNHFQQSIRYMNNILIPTIPQWDVCSAQQHLIIHFKLKKGPFLISISFLSAAEWQNCAAYVSTLISFCCIVASSRLAFLRPPGFTNCARYMSLNAVNDACNPIRPLPNWVHQLCASPRVSDNYGH